MIHMAKLDTSITIPLGFGVSTVFFSLCGNTGDTATLLPDLQYQVMYEF